MKSTGGKIINVIKTTFYGIENQVYVLIFVIHSPKIPKSRNTYYDNIIYYVKHIISEKVYNVLNSGLTEASKKWE